MKKIRVLVVDDSPSMRGIMRAVLNREEDIEVVGMAADPHEARAAIKSLNPDVMTLDVEMPGMNGIEFLEKVMRLRPMPVVMVSTLTAKGASVAVAALSLGAVDCIAKPTAADPDSLRALPNIVRAAAGSAATLGGNCPARSGPNERRQSPNLAHEDLPIVVGASTGGVEALEILFSAFNAECPPVLVVQHMPAGYTTSLAERLNTKLLPHVVEAEDHMEIQSGTIYLAPGGHRHMEVRAGRTPRIALKEADKVTGHRPSVDVMFRSAARAWGGKCVGVLLTGMGEDGARGLRELADLGAATFAQDRATSVVFGMPAAAQRLGAVETLTPLSWMAGSVRRAAAAPRNTAVGLGQGAAATKGHVER